MLVVSTTNDHVFMMANEMGDEFDRLGHGHRDFHNRDATPRDRIGGKVRVLRRTDSNRWDDA
jgi:hypothetical protein